MIRKLAGIAIAVGLAAASALASSADRANAAQRCAAQRSAIGASAFRQLYGANANRSNAFGKCVSKLTRENAQIRATAEEQCRAEQKDPNFPADHGGKTFAEFYGTGKNAKNAFGKCVSLKAKAMRDDRQEATINAAKECKAERKTDPVAFRKKYGTNKNGRNAFAKCVVAKVRG